MYETFEHTADLGLRVRAASLDELFREAALGLFSMIVPDLSSVRAAEEIEFALVGDSPDLLLFDWLNELLYTYETRHLLFAKFGVSVSDLRLNATAVGEKFDPARHVLDHEVKAITYHGLKLVREGSEWLAEVIVDI